MKVCCLKPAGRGVWVQVPKSRNGKLEATYIRGKVLGSKYLNTMQFGSQNTQVAYVATHAGPDHRRFGHWEPLGFRLFERSGSIFKCSYYRLGLGSKHFSGLGFGLSLP